MFDTRYAPGTLVSINADWVVYNTPAEWSGTEVLGMVISAPIREEYEQWRYVPVLIRGRIMNVGRGGLRVVSVASE